MFAALASSFLSLISPPRCVSCMEYMHERFPLCNHCKKRIKPIVTTEIALTPRYSMKVIALSHYEEPIASLIKAKYHGARYAGTYLGQLLWDCTYISTLDIDCFVPIPLHWSRYAIRGFNQAECIAQTLSYLSGKPVADLLQRTRRTVTQAGLVALQRRKNVHDVFSITESNILSDKHIILIDDLMTTGATLQAAGKLLLTGKPRSLTALVAARVV